MGLAIDYISNYNQPELKVKSPLLRVLHHKPNEMLLDIWTSSFAWLALNVPTTPELDVEVRDRVDTLKCVEYLFRERGVRPYWNGWHYEMVGVGYGGSADWATELPF